VRVSLCSYLIAFFIVSCSESESNKSGENNNDSIPQIDTVITETHPLCLIHQDIDTFYIGDMNKDGKEDTAIVFSPFYAYPSTIDFSGGGCEDDSCLTIVKFNFSEIPLKHKEALGFQSFFATEDLNSDGIKEVAFIPNWFQSCWQGLFVYSLDKSGWKHIGTGSVFACADEDFTSRVLKIDRHNFKIIGVKWNEDGSEMLDTAIIHKW